MGRNLAPSTRQNTSPATKVCIRSTDIARGTYSWLTTATSAAARGIEGGRESEIVLKRCRSLFLHLLPVLVVGNIQNRAHRGHNEELKPHELLTAVHSTSAMPSEAVVTLTGGTCTSAELRVKSSCYCRHPNGP